MKKQQRKKKPPAKKKGAGKTGSRTRGQNKRKTKTRTAADRKNKKEQTKDNPRAAGRPEVEIDWSVVEKLCAIFCTLEEIAGFFDCSEDTIERACLREHGVKFAEYYINKSSEGKISLRREQFRVAQKGNTRMLTWLGIQHLGQKHRHDITTGKRLDYRDVKKRLQEVKDPAERSKILMDFIMQNNE